MKLSTREKWMCALLPALLTGIIYQRAWMSPRRAEIEALKKQIQTQGPLAVREEAVKQEKDERAQLEKSVDRHHDGGDRGKFNRGLALQQISRLCEEKQLILLSIGADSSAKLPPAIEQAAAVLVKKGDPAAPQVWRLELRGNYGDVLELLDGLATAPALIVPLSIGMLPGANERVPLEWTINLWM